MNPAWVALLFTIGGNLIFIGYQSGQFINRKDLNELLLAEPKRFEQYIATWNAQRADRYTGTDATKDQRLQAERDALQDQRTLAQYNALLHQVQDNTEDIKEVRKYLQQRFQWETK